ncbi:hypothetical protein [Runella slithyformis]|uniref:Response regulatory domain-containing protein n=1 Tax=Runella slithyformis (strain ATCC 29530 / DSM 19594 / LMG 11500 / NCIMB 11436 / LSU 4) TaxID=761193 RepID=A0A7U3ZP58_RUNSL|nr:hypothetical protein [Runella slithyformis]AEI50807.1 hypothetical protein Runsl_4485 [Runella slithyformis DSM 19594]
MSIFNTKVLLFEDKLDNISQIESMIRASGYEVIRALASPKEDLRMNIMILQSHIIIAHDSLSNTMLSAAQKMKEGISVIMIGTSDESVLLPGSGMGKMAYVKAPFTKDVLKAVIDFIKG